MKHLVLWEVRNLIYSEGHFMVETGVVNVIGGFNLTLGLMYSAGYEWPFNFVFGLGFVF